MGIIKYPIINEKTTAGHQDYVYTFVVEKTANKIQIAQAVKDKWNVEVDSVRTVNVLGKSKTRFTKKGLLKGRKNSYKKAYVSISKNQDPIDLYASAE